MIILDWLCPDSAMLAFPKCGTNCSNNELISPSPTQAAKHSNIISTATKADLFGEKKAPNSKLSESVKIRKYGEVGKPQPSGINKSKSTFGSPSKRKQNSKPNKANNRLPEIYKSLTSFDSNEYLDILPFQLRLLLKRPRVKIK